jgi:rubrerythrin
MGNLKNEHLDNEIIRSSIVAELNAINYCEQLSTLTTNSAIKNLLLSAITGKKNYVEALQALLNKYDAQKTKDDKKAQAQSLWNMC